MENFAEASSEEKYFNKKWALFNNIKKDKVWLQTNL